jgi:hypothetical protein
MARFSLSFLAVFLVLAAFVMSMPTKRDQSKGLGLDTALSELQVSGQESAIDNAIVLIDLLPGCDQVHEGIGQQGHERPEQPSQE